MAGNIGSYAMQKKPFKRLFEAHRRHPHKKKDDRTPPGQCPCVAFRLCDAGWGALPGWKQIDWNLNVKKDRMTGYMLWMKECLCTMNQFGTYPLEPTESGGYSCRYVEPTGEPPEGGIGLHVPPEPEGYTCLYPLPGTNCPDCFPNTPEHICITFTDMTGDWEHFNRTYTLPQGGACWWNYETHDLFEIFANAVGGRSWVEFQVNILDYYQTWWVFRYTQDIIPARCRDHMVLIPIFIPEDQLPMPAQTARCHWHTQDWTPDP